MAKIYILFFGFILGQGCHGQNPKTDSIALDSVKMMKLLAETASNSKPLEDALPTEMPLEAEALTDEKASNWFHINTFDSTIAFSKIARLGKISVFVVSTAWCAPCKTLKAALKQQNQFTSKVDFYDINMCYQRKYSELEKVDAYAYARIYDRLKEWPRVVITSPTGSIIKSFSAIDLEQEDIKNRLYDAYVKAAAQHQKDINIPALQDLTGHAPTVLDKTLEIVERLLKDDKYFHVQKVVQSVPNRR
jgi:thiol-disulfide isomerase/thioredoxin